MYLINNIKYFKESTQSKSIHYSIASKRFDFQSYSRVSFKILKKEKQFPTLLHPNGVFVC